VPRAGPDAETAAITYTDESSGAGPAEHEVVQDIHGVLAVQAAM
jgi:hypothetical protein